MKILVVEDEIRQQDWLTRNLSSAEHEVTAAEAESDGRSHAVSKSRDKCVAVIFTITLGTIGTAVMTTTACAVLTGV